MNDLLKASKRVLKTLSQLNLGDYPPPLQGGLNDEIEDLFEAIKKAENQKSMALEEFIQTYQKGYREGKEDALAQPEQELVALSDEWTPCVKLPIVVHVRKQRKGETHISTREGITPVLPDDLIMRGIAGEEYPIGRELFVRTYTFDTAPPKREWVGLTDEEYDELMLSGDWGGSLIQATQNKLKEKNT